MDFFLQYTITKRSIAIKVGPPSKPLHYLPPPPSKKNKSKYFIAIGSLGATVLTLVPFVIYYKTKNVPLPSNAENVDPQNISQTSALQPNLQEVKEQETISTLSSDTVTSNTESEDPSQDISEKNISQTIDPQLDLPKTDKETTTPEKSPLPLVQVSPSSTKTPLRFDKHYLNRYDPYIIDNEDFSLESNFISPFRQSFIPRWVKENIDIQQTIPNEMLDLVSQYCSPPTYVHCLEDRIEECHKEGKLGYSTRSGKVYKIPFSASKDFIPHKLVSDDQKEVRKDGKIAIQQVSSTGDKLILRSFFIGKDDIVLLDTRVIDATSHEILYQSTSPTFHTILYKQDANLLLLQEKDKLLIWLLSEKKPVELPQPHDNIQYKKQDFPRISLDRKVVTHSFLNKDRKTCMAIWHLDKNWHLGENITYHCITSNELGRKKWICTDDLPALQLSPKGDTLIATEITENHDIKVVGWKLDTTTHTYEQVFARQIEIEEDYNDRNLSIAMYDIDNETYLHYSYYLEGKGYGTYFGKFIDFQTADLYSEENKLRNYEILACRGKDKLLLKDKNGSLCIAHNGSITRLNEKKVESKVIFSISYNKISIAVLWEKYSSKTKAMIFDAELNFIRTIDIPWTYFLSPIKLIKIKASKDYRYVAISIQQDRNPILQIYSLNDLVNKDIKNVAPLHRINLLHEVNLKKDSSAHLLLKKASPWHPRLKSIDSLERNRFILNYEITNDILKNSNKEKIHYVSFLVGLGYS